jgi:hypothetical protein
MKIFFQGVFEKVSGRTAGVAVLILSVLFLLAVQGFGIGKSGRSLTDADLYYAAGLCWSAGGSMYDAELFNGTLRELFPERFENRQYGGLAYAPTMAPITRLFASVSLETFRSVFHVTSVIAAGLLAYLTVLYRRLNSAKDKPLNEWFLAALILVSPFTQHVLWLGQAALWVCLSIMAGWYLIRYTKWVGMGGSILALATIKPHFLVFPLIWLMLERRWKALLSFFGAIAVLLVYPFWQQGPMTCLSDALRELLRYQHQPSPADMLGSMHTVGLPSLLTVLGFSVSPFPFICFVFVITVFLYLSRWSTRDGVDPLPFILTSYIALGYSHVPDIIFLYPAVAALWLYFDSRPIVWIGWIIMVGLFAMPQQIVRSYDSLLLLQWRSFLSLLVLASLLFQLVRPYRHRSAGIPTTPL